VFFQNVFIARFTLTARVAGLMLPRVT